MVCAIFDIIVTHRLTKCLVGTSCQHLINNLNSVVNFIVNTSYTTQVVYTYPKWGGCTWCDSNTTIVVVVISLDCLLHGCISLNQCCMTHACIGIN